MADEDRRDEENPDSPETKDSSQDELVKEIEEDPAQNPQDEMLRDIKGG